MSNPLSGAIGGFSSTGGTTYANSVNTAVTIPTLPYPNGQLQVSQIKPVGTTSIKQSLEESIRVKQDRAQKVKDDLAHLHNLLNKLNAYDPKVVELYEHLSAEGHLSHNTPQFVVLDILQAHTDAIEYKTTLSNL